MFEIKNRRQFLRSCNVVKWIVPYEVISDRSGESVWEGVLFVEGVCSAYSTVVYGRSLENVVD